MKQHPWTALAASVLAMLAIGAGQPAGAEELSRTATVAGITVHYKVVLPDHYDPSRTYPAVLGFGGGPQTMQTVDGLIDNYLRAQAQQRGYIVIVPAAPRGQLFFEGGERIFPAFLQQLLAQYHIEDNKFHAAGPSNGGISAFRVASLNPQYFLSITAFPGYLPDPTAAHIQAISGMCIHMFVGELDPLGWQDAMRRQAQALRARGIHADYTVEQGQPHRLQSLAGPNAHRLFDLFEQARHGCAGPRAAAATPAAPR
jgi:poly(3-hydroxybutyrate) depolymerase